MSSRTAEEGRGIAPCGTPRSGRSVIRPRFALAAAVAVLALLGPLVWTMPTLLLWNASASRPEGLYAVRPWSGARRGDVVVAWAPAEARRLAAVRHYLPATAPLVKRVAAVGGDLACASGRRITVNGERIAFRRKADPAGRTLPRWNGCRRLADGEFLLVGEGPLAFDGRYFGVTGPSSFVGRAVLIWRR